jgi:phenylacetate-coenzyme A ligase PaaK-like adenylate-forming protein
MELSDRFPLIPAGAAQRLRWLEEHPHAPRFTHPGVDRVTAEGLADAVAYAETLRAAPPRWQPGETPTWVGPFIERCCRTTPFYRRYGAPPRRLADAPTCNRADLARAPWAFVPDDQPLADMIVYNTSGTTGHPLAIPTHPDTLARYIPLLAAALATHGIVLEGGAARPAAILQVCWQRRTYTMAGLLAALDWAGFVKINLNPAEWRRPEDVAAFVDACAPEVITGDPLSFAELARLPVTARPTALVSTAMALAPELQATLATRFDCPVLDIYSLNESGPVAVGMTSAETAHSERVDDTEHVAANSQRRVSESGGDSSLDSRHHESIGADPLRMTAGAILGPRVSPQSDGITANAAGDSALATRRNALHEADPLRVTDGAIFRLLQSQLYVEILASDGAPCPPGVTGEVVLTGGFNPRLPLLRYRTGDTAALVYCGVEPCLVGLSGRPPVVFIAADGRRVNNVDVSNALRPFPISWHALYQAADGCLTLRVAASAVGESALRAALAGLFGADQPLTIVVEDAGPPEGKVVGYTSDR